MNQPHNLEETLERMGSLETPGDTAHRYALRRALTRSKHFDTNRAYARWLRVFSVTTSVVAGGAVIATLIVAVQVTIPDDSARQARLASLREQSRRNFEESHVKLVPMREFREFVGRQLEFASAR